MRVLNDVLAAPKGAIEISNTETGTTRHYVIAQWKPGSWFLHRANDFDLESAGYIGMIREIKARKWGPSRYVLQRTRASNIGPFTRTWRGAEFLCLWFSGDEPHENIDIKVKGYPNAD
jgi:hypothetical protein